MKTSLRLAGILLSFLVSQALSAELEPCSRYSEDYYREVDRRIDGAVGPNANLSITTLPSFEAESGVRLFKDAVYFVQFHESLWAKDALEQRPADSPSPKITVTVTHASLDRQLVDRIGTVFSEAIGRAAKSGRAGVDGTTYRISANAACGQAWSPEPGSPTARLIELVDLLQNHAQLSEHRDIQRSELTIVRLLATIRSR